MANNEYKHDIYERIFEFVVEVLKAVEKLPKNTSNLVIINQLTRSVTSMGANSCEADGTNSRKDFIHCFTIVRKEGKETLYWLRLIQRLNGKNNDIKQSMLDEGNEIVAIISTIIKNTLNNYPKTANS